MSLTVLETRRNRCKWPLGSGEDMTFCGCPTENKSYWCQTHRSIASNPTTSPDKFVRGLRKYIKR